ncbi:exportin 1 protein [Rutstroemia sp. NJR-2017a BBW]|nr:exportin 1 protein [Rutstroemia sp. NJR-2017a BBW]
MALGSLAHGFSDWTPGNASTASQAPVKEVTAEFSRAAEAILIALEALKSSFDLAELRFQYLTFIQVILNNELASVLVSETNQAFFDPVILSVTTLAKTVANTTGALAASRLAFSIMAKMTDLWGGPNIARLGAQPVAASGPPQPAFPGFDTFLIERFHPVCWEVLRESQFRPGMDAQAKTVLNEIAGLEQVIYMKTGNMFVEHLQGSFFPSMGVDGSGFVTAMVENTDRKGLAGFLLKWLKGSG